MGHIYIYTGNGAGKTANALGLALRTVGHGLKAIIVQFMKGREDVGEYKIKDRLSPDYEIYQFGNTEFLAPRKIKETDRKLARDGLAFAQKMLALKPTLLVLDEINLAIHFGLLDLEDVLGLLEMIPKETNIVLTGRYASQKLRERADFVNEIVDVKHPQKMIATKGIQY